MRVSHFGGSGSSSGTVAAAELGFEFAVTCLIDNDKRSSARADAKRVGIGKTSPGPKHLKESFGLRLDLTEESRFLKDDCPGEQRQDKQDAQDHACDPTRLFKQSERAGKNDQRQTRNNIPQEKNL
jgi:hypothetical protein